jgi:hypothetical protein
MVLGVVHAVPLKIWTMPDQPEYGIAYRGRIYPLSGDKATGKHYIEIEG